jgi:hypothetical protein
MGANYEVLLCPASPEDDLVEILGSFLSLRDLAIVAVGELGTIEVKDERVIVLSPPCNGWVQIVANLVGLRVNPTEWVESNPLAGFLSVRRGYGVHIWSDDSGYDCGYSLYVGGDKRECACVFTSHARNRQELWSGVPAPSNRYGARLGELIGQKDYDFSAEVAKQRCLEIGLAKVVSMFGFGIHLLDYYEVLDEKEGIAVQEVKYSAVALSGWIAIEFQ